MGFHRDRRSKFSLESRLDNIKGIGSISKDKLMKRFKSFERIQNAETQELVDEIGKDKTKLILKFLKRN